MKDQRILFLGVGKLGGQILDLLLRLPGKQRFLVGGRDLASLRPRVNLSLLSALQLGHTPEVECISLDLNNIDQMASILAQFCPDLVFCAATFHPSNQLPRASSSLAQQLTSAPMGPRLPFHLTLMYKLMQAVRLAGREHRTKVLNAIYPDVVHPILAKVGLAPLTGIGDLANNVPALRLSIAHKLEKPIEQVDVRLVMARWVSYWMSRKNIATAPFHFTALVQGEDCTHLLEHAHLFDDLPTRLHRLGGDLGLMMTAASAATLVHALLSDQETIVHAPGPNGLPGGYPVRLNTNGVEVVLPPGLTLEVAQEINTAGLRLDGIERIAEDGTVFFTEEAVSLYQRLLGYVCKRLPIQEAEEREKELHERYKEKEK